MRVELRLGEGGPSLKGLGAERNTVGFGKSFRDFDVKVAMLEPWFLWEFKCMGTVLGGLSGVLQGQDTQTRFTETSYSVENGPKSAGLG